MIDSGDYTYNKPEPAPVKNTSTPIWELVIKDMQERDNIGRAKYGTPLQVDNGRDPLVDAYQEGLDQVVYLRQEIEQRKRGTVKRGEVEALRQECGQLTASVASLRLRLAEAANRYDLAGMLLPATKQWDDFYTALRDERALLFQFIKSMTEIMSQIPHRQEGDAIPEAESRVKGMLEMINYMRPATGTLHSWQDVNQMLDAIRDAK